MKDEVFCKIGDKSLFKIGETVKYKGIECVILGIQCGLETWYKVKFNDGIERCVEESKLKRFDESETEEIEIKPKFAVEDFVVTLDNKVGVVTEIKEDTHFPDAMKHFEYKINIINTDSYSWVTESYLRKYSLNPTWNDFKDMTVWTDSIKVPIYCNNWFKYWSAYFKLFTVAKVLNNGWNKDYSNKGWELTYMQAIEVSEYHWSAGTIYFKTREIAYKAKSILTNEEFESLFKCV